jgi:hypothetical protein
MSSRRFGFRDADFSIGEEENVFGPKRLYNRTDEEIEEMIERVMVRMHELKRIFERSRGNKERSAAMAAARNWKALEGVNQALRWCLAEVGVEHPLY